MRTLAEPTLSATSTPTDGRGPWPVDLFRPPQRILEGERFALLSQGAIRPEPRETRAMQPSAQLGTHVRQFVARNPCVGTHMPVLLREHGLCGPTPLPCQARLAWLVTALVSNCMIPSAYMLSLTKKASKRGSTSFSSCRATPILRTASMFALSSAAIEESLEMALGGRRSPASTWLLPEQSHGPCARGRQRTIPPNTPLWATHR